MKLHHLYQICAKVVRITKTCLLAWLNWSRQTIVCGLGFECWLMIAWCQLSCREIERPAANNGCEPGLDKENKTSSWDHTAHNGRPPRQWPPHAQHSRQPCAPHDIPALCRLPAFCFPVCQSRVSCQHLWKVEEALLLYKHNDVWLHHQPILEESIDGVCAGVCVCVCKPSARISNRGPGFVGFYPQRPDSDHVMPRLHLFDLI